MEPSGVASEADALSSIRDYVSSGDSAEERLLRAQRMMQRIQDLEIDIKDFRRDAIISLHEDSHWTHQQIAEFAGITKGRVRQIIVQYDAPTRPGIMEHNIRIAAAASKETDAHQRARHIYNAVKGIKGIESLPRQQWAAYTDIPEDVWQEILDTEA